MTPQSPKIYIASHRGMVGSAIVRHLLAHGVKKSQLVNRTRAELGPTHKAALQAFFTEKKTYTSTCTSVSSWWVIKVIVQMPLRRICSRVPSNPTCPHNFDGSLKKT
jgi:hypothetical protein